MKLRSIAAILTLSGIFLFSACEVVNNAESDAEDNQPKIYNIGDVGPSGVGTVIYVSNGGLNGLEVAPANWHADYGDPTMSWSNITGTEIGSDAQGVFIGTGLANSNAIVNQPGHTRSAAKLCRDYNGGGKNDWYLPSLSELYQLFYYDNDFFEDNGYWTSTENGYKYAIYIYSGGQAVGNKGDIGGSVRPFRAF